MATKKSSKSTKTKTAKTTKATIDHNHIGKCFVAFGLIITALLFGFFYLLGQRKSYDEKQKLLAFDSLVQSYLDEEFYISGERTATVTGKGMTDDNDLYYDFVINTLENNVIMTNQKARLHFQCHEADSLKLKNGCSKAYWYGDVVETSAEFREKSRIFNETTENYVNAINAAETEEQKEALKKEYDKFVKENQNIAE